MSIPISFIQRIKDTHQDNPDIDIPRQIIDALANGDTSLTDVVDYCEKLLIERLLDRQISQTELAERLGITRRTLYSRLKLLGMDDDSGD